MFINFFKRTFKEKWQKTLKHFMFSNFFLSFIKRGLKFFNSLCFNLSLMVHYYCKFNPSPWESTGGGGEVVVESNTQFYQFFCFQVIIKSVHEPCGPSDKSLFWFPKHEVTKSISTPPWMGCRYISIKPISNKYVTP